MKNTQISGGRKALYYIGMGLIALGLLSFFSTFISAALHFGDFRNFEQNSRSMMLRAFGGMGMIFLGAILSGIGRLGAAGSGVVLDPEQARRDVEPWSRMAGGVVDDALEEVEAVDRIAGRVAGEGEEKVKVRCRKCRALNDEDARFCDQCGAEM